MAAGVGERGCSADRRRHEGYPKSTISGYVTLERDSGGVSIQNVAVSQLQVTGCAGGVIVTGNTLPERSPSMKNQADPP